MNKAARSSLKVHIWAILIYCTCLCAISHQSARHSTARHDTARGNPGDDDGWCCIPVYCMLYNCGLVSILFIAALEVSIGDFG